MPSVSMMLVVQGDDNKGFAMDSYMTVEVWVLVDGDGDYVIAKDRESLAEKYEEEFTTLNSEVTTRFIKLTVQVPTPKPVELSAVVAEELATGGLKAA
jgi:hypothetical protein